MKVPKIPIWIRLTLKDIYEVLSPKERKMLDAILYSGLPYQEICDNLGLKANAATQLVDKVYYKLDRYGTDKALRLFILQLRKYKLKEKRRKPPAAKEIVNRGVLRFVTQEELMRITKK